MNEITQLFTELLKAPALLLNQCEFLPDFIKESILQCINFIPILYFLYLIIEYLERFFLKHIGIFIKLLKNFGAIFGIIISNVPECGYPIIASIFYSRKMITRGTLLAFLIGTSDDAIPLLFMDLSKATVVLPIIIIKIIVGLIVAFSIDFLSLFTNKRLENINAINTDIYEPACCYHRLSTIDNPPYWWVHPITHTFNMFVFTCVSLIFIDCISLGYGGNEQLAKLLLIDTPYQVIIGGIFGLIQNCFASVFIAMAFIKGIISFPTLVATLITTTGIALMTLTKHNRKDFDNIITITILLLSGIIAGLLIYYNIFNFQNLI